MTLATAVTDMLSKSDHNKLRRNAPSRHSQIVAEADDFDYGAKQNYAMPEIPSTTPNLSYVSAGQWAWRVHWLGKKPLKGGGAKGYLPTDEYREHYGVEVERCHLTANAYGGLGDSENWAPMTRAANLMQKSRYEDAVNTTMHAGHKPTTNAVAKANPMATTEDAIYQTAYYDHDPKPDAGEFDGMLYWQWGYLGRDASDNLITHHNTTGTVPSAITVRARKNQIIGNLLGLNTANLVNVIKDAESAHGDISSWSLQDLINHANTSMPPGSL